MAMRDEMEKKNHEKHMRVHDRTIRVYTDKSEQSVSKGYWTPYCECGLSLRSLRSLSVH